MSETDGFPVERRSKRFCSIAKASVQQFTDGGTDRAAAMAYYAIQSLFPGLLVVVLLSLLLSTPQSVTNAVNWAKDQGLDPTLAAQLETTLQSAADRASSGPAGLATILAGAASVLSASGWLAAAGRAIEPDSQRRRSHNPITGRIRFSLWTLLLLALLVLGLTMLTLGGGVADTVFDWFGAQQGAPLAWDVLQPILVLFGILGSMLLLYRVAPDRVHSPPLRSQLPGAIVAGLGWIVASGAFVFYVRHIATLGATYGAFATPIILLLWLWLSGVVVLLGAEVNAELARRRDGPLVPHQLDGANDPRIAGHPAGVLPEGGDAADEPREGR